MHAFTEQSPTALQLYPHNALNLLEFQQIRTLLAARCQSRQAAERALSLVPETRHDLIADALNLVKEYELSTQTADRWPELTLPELRPILAALEIEGNLIEAESWRDVKFMLRSCFQVYDFLARKKQALPRLAQLAHQLTINRTLFTRIDKVVDEEGEMKPDASKTLQTLHDRVNRARTELRKKIDSIYRKAREEGWTGDGLVGLRDGRLVIPLLAEHKRKIRGFIIDESATGQTVYLEPAEVLELNNEVRDMELAWKREVRRILLELADSIRPELSLLLEYLEFLTHLDYIRACHLFSLEYEGIAVGSLPQPALQFFNARHPLLLIHHRKQAKPVVPFSLKLDAEKRILLISGPNAGGKSITLKAVGLLHLMAQSGLPIPSAPESGIQVFKKIFVNIGDDQSIENDLSTYSSHLTHMKAFTENADADSLFLIDEFGTGTDPQIGGPIAEAILEQLVQTRAKGIVNTHFSNLKAFASRTEAVVNAAMTFDTKSLQPRYELVTGQPGSSFALEIARKIGLSSAILQAAGEKIGQRTQNVEDLLLELENEKQEMNKLKHLVRQKDELLDDLIKKHQINDHEIKIRKQEIIRKTREEMKEMLARTNREVENVIRSIRESKADKEVVMMARETLKAIQEDLKPREKEAKSDGSATPNPVIGGPLQVGGYVRIRQTQATALLLEIKKNKAVLESNSLRMTVALEDLEPVSNAEARKQRRQTVLAATPEVSSATQAAIQQQMEFVHQLDLRGYRTQDAIATLEKFLDKAVVAGYGELRILHGKGDGILRRFVRENLKGNQWVSHFESEHADRGGDGVTLVKMK